MNVIEMFVELMIAAMAEMLCMVSAVAIAVALAIAGAYLYYTRDQS